MARTRLIRSPFDARHEFVVTPPAGRSALPVGGKALLAGQRFDKDLVTARRLRQMYDARLIAVAPGSALPAVRPPRPRAIGPAEGAQPPPSAPPPQAQVRRPVLLRRLRRAA